MLKKHKDKFKAGLLHSAEEYKKSVALLLDEFNNKGPFSSDKETSQVCWSCDRVTIIIYHRLSRSSEKYTKLFRVYSDVFFIALGEVYLPVS